MRRLLYLGLCLCLFLVACGGSAPAEQAWTSAQTPPGAVQSTVALVVPTPTIMPTATPTARPTPTLKAPTSSPTRPRPSPPATIAPTVAPTFPPARLAVVRTVREQTARCSVGLPAGFSDDPTEANVWRTADRLVSVKLEAPSAAIVSLDSAVAAGLGELQGRLASFREVSRNGEGYARRVAFTGQIGGASGWGTLALRQFGLDFCQVTVLATTGTTLLLDPLIETMSASLVAANPRPAPLGYLALGDSYAVGVGATDPATGGYAARFAATLRGPQGEPVGLRNLAIPGATSADYLGDWPTRGQEGTAPLAAAVRALAVGGVTVVTIDIGGNDVLRLLKPGQPCADADIAGAACLAAMREALQTMSAPSLPRILGALTEAAAPGTQIFVLTYPNPFSAGQSSLAEARTGLALAELNALIAETVRALATGASARQVTLTLVDLAPLFTGEGANLTHIRDTPPDIHPNDVGHRTIAEALTRAQKR